MKKSMFQKITAHEVNQATEEYNKLPVNQKKKEKATIVFEKGWTASTKILLGIILDDLLVFNTEAAKRALNLVILPLDKYMLDHIYVE